jgi:hypothetical protein
MLWGNLVSTGGDVQAQAGGALPNARTRRRAAPNKFSEFRDAVRMGIHTHTAAGLLSRASVGAMSSGQQKKLARGRRLQGLAEQQQKGREGA